MLMSCGGGSLVGSGNPASEVREVGPFDEVQVTGMKLELDLGPLQRVELFGDDNVLPALTTEVVGRTLYVRPNKHVTLEPVTSPAVRVTARALHTLGVNADFDSTVTGVEAVSFSATLSGAGSLTLTGLAYELAAVANGTGTLDASGLTADHVKATVTGSGGIRVCAEETLDATITGSGDIVYSCDPRVTSRHTPGSGRVIDAMGPQ